MSVLANHFHVRIVASRTAYTLVVSQEALAEGQPVRLKPDIFLAKQTLPDHGLPGVMTLAAKARHLFGRHLSQFPRGRRRLTPGHALHVRIGARMTMLAVQARLQGGERQFTPTHGAGGVTTETIRDFLLRRLPPHGFGQVMRLDPD